MIKEKPISEIEAELYEVLALKELSFGCVFEFFNRLASFHKMTCLEFDGENMTYFENGKTKTTKGLSGDFTIIGHEPTLNNVLLKLREKQGDGDLDVLCSHNGGILKADMSEITTIFKPLTKYDLTKSFDSQTEETKRKLHKLLK